MEDDDYLVEDVGGKAGKRGGDRDKGKGLEAHLRCMRENGKLGACFVALVLYPNLILS